MSSNAYRILAVILVVVALVLVFVAYRVSHNYAAQQQAAAAQPPAGPPKTLVVMATKPLAANQPVKRDDVALVPVEIAPTEYFSNVGDVVGLAPLVDIDAGAPITPRLFKKGNWIAKNIPPGFQAISLKISDVIGVGSFVLPGDRVDVLVYLRGNQTDQVDTQARILLANALVLAFDDKVVEAPKGIQKDPNNPQQQNVQHERTVVIAVPIEQTTRIMLGASMGEVRLALRGQDSGIPQVASGSSAAAAMPAANTMPLGSASGNNSLPAGNMLPQMPGTGPKVPADVPISAAQLAHLTVPPPRKLAAPPPLVRRHKKDAGIDIIRGCKCSTGRS